MEICLHFDLCNERSLRGQKKRKKKGQSGGTFFKGDSRVAPFLMRNEQSPRGQGIYEERAECTTVHEQRDAGNNAVILDDCRCAKAKSSREFLL